MSMIGMKKQQQPRPKFNDNVMVVRVKNYLAENVDKTFVDVSQMARSLKERYREYANRNEGAFQQMVESAYKEVVRSYGLDSLDDGSSSERSEEDSDELEMLDDSNNLNDQLMAMYKMQESGKAPGNKKDKNAGKSSELIDISSDDSNMEKTTKLPKINDQVTITKAQKVNNSAPQEVKSKKMRVIAPEPILQQENKKRRSNDQQPHKPSVKQRKSEAVRPQPRITFADIGGISAIIEQVSDLILHMKHPEVYQLLGIKSPRGALLHGPPGTGKTLLANAIAGNLKLPIFSVTAPELVAGVSGESEERIRELFEKAAALSPCVLFIDEIDAICGNRLHAQKDMERRIVSQILSSMDSLGERNASVLVLAATSNADGLDPALRRAGRLEQDIALGIPTVAARHQILKILAHSIALNPDVDFEILAQLTPGFVGADLQALINKACTVALKRVFQLLKKLKDAKSNKIATVETEKRVNGNSETDVINLDENAVAKTTENGESSEPVESKESETAESKTESTAEPVKEVNREAPEVPTAEEVPFESMNYLEDTAPYTREELEGMSLCNADFLNALKSVRPCAIREGIATVPDVTWDDIGSLKEVREELQLAVLAPVKYPKQLKLLGLEVPSGILLCGPPGCGKTLLAKAVANEAGVNFISVKGPELLNMYVGESERAVRTCFQRAKNSAPCVIFFDEFDSLCPKRSQGDSGGATRVVNQLLTEMDGVESRQGVFVLAASNRPDIIDPAVLRPGRLDRVVYVGMPQLRDRVEILNAITKKGTRPPMSGSVDVQFIAGATEGFSGADLAGLVRQAATRALAQFVAGDRSSDPVITLDHFHEALAKVKPSVSTREQQHYEKLRLKYASSTQEETPEVEMDTASANEESMDTV